MAERKYKYGFVITGDSASAKRALTELKKTAGQFNKTADKTSASVRSIGASASTASQQMSKFTRIMTVVTKASIATYMVERMGRLSYQMAEAAESVDLLRKKLEFITKDNTALRQTIEMANELGVSMTELGATATRFAVASKGAFSFEQILKWQKAIILSGKAVGLSSQEAAAGTRQLSQAFSKGKLDGDELRSVMENFPILAEEMHKYADKAGKSIFDMGKNGELTKDVMVEMLDVLGERMEGVSGVTDTLASNVTRLENEWALLLNTMSNGNSTVSTSFQTLAGWVKALSESYKELYENQNLQAQADAELKWVQLTKEIKENKKWLEDNAWANGVSAAAVELTAGKTAMLEVALEGVNAELAMYDKLLNKNGTEENQLGPATAHLSEWNSMVKESGDVTEKYTAASEKNAITLKRYNVLLDRGLITLKTYNAAKNTLFKTTTKISTSKKLEEQNNEALLESEWKQIVAVDEYIEKLEEELRLLQFVGVEKEIQIALSEAGVKATTEEGLQIAELTKELYKKEAALKKHVKIVKEEVPQAYKNAATSIQSSFTDLFRDVFDGGEDAFDDFADHLEDTFKNLLAEMATLAITQPIIVPITQALGGAMGLSSNQIGQTVGQLGGSPLNYLSAGVSTYNAFTGGSYINGFLAGDGMFGGLGASIGSLGASSAFMGAGAGASQAAMLAAQTGSFGAAGTAMTSSALGGSTLGSAIGGIGTALPYIGAAVAIAGLLGAFGGDSDTTPDLSLKYSSNGNLSDPVGSKLKTYGAEGNGSYDPQFNIGGRFAEINWGSQHDAFSSQSDVDNFAAQISTRYLTLENMIFNAFGEQVSKEISLAMDSFSTGEIKIEEFAGAGDFNKAFNKIFSSIFAGVGRNVSDDVSRYEKVFTDALGVTGSLEASTGLVGAVKSIADAGSSRSFTSIVDVMTNFVSGVDELETQMIELVAATQLLTAENNGLFTNLVAEIIDLNQIEGMTAQRGVELITVLTSVNSIFETLKLNTYDYTIAGANLSETLAAGAGGMDALIAKTAYYYDNFYTDLEKNNRIIELGQKALEDFGVASVTSTQSLRAYIETLSGDEYEALFNSALNLAPALVAMEKAIEDKNKLEITGISDAGAALDEFYSNMLKHIQDIDDYLNGLQFSDLSTLTNQQQFDAAGQQFFSTVNAARAGDLDAAGNLTSVSQTFLEIARTIYASSNAYQAVYGTVTDALGTISSMSEVEAAYISTLGRTGEAAGVSYWEGTGLTGDALSSAMLNASANVPQSARDYLFESGQSVPVNSSADVASALQSLQAEIAAQTEAIVASNYDANEQNAVKIIDGTVERTAVVLR